MKLGIVRVKKTEIIDVKSGKIRGYIKKDLYVFKGIPYAQPPIGELRLNAPVLKTSWDGVLEAMRFSPIAPQPPPYTNYFPPPPQSEANCLTLNIWTPGIDDKKRPIMFWIHGGSNIYGSGQIYGNNLANRGDVVVVTINYRLGALGNLYFPGAPANIAPLDQVTALKWVKENIEYFGGDPDNITVFGESAGGTSICTLMAMPRAKGLFNRAIIQSGVPTPNGYNLSDRKLTSEWLLEELKLKSYDIEEFRKLPVEKIIKALVKIQEKGIARRVVNINVRPWIDGEILPQHPIKAINEGFAKDIELITGTNLEEYKFWRAFEPNFQDMSLSKLTNRLKNDKVPENEIAQIIETYTKTLGEQGLPSTPREIFDKYKTESVFRIPSIKFAEAQSKHQKDTYMYLFTWKTPFDNGKYGSLHALEVAFVFHTFLDEHLWIFPKRTEETVMISEKMMDYWLSFAKTGDPNNNGVFNWPRYDIVNRKTIIFNTNIEIKDDPLSTDRLMWNDVKIWSQF
jgi:para-nitrobenzyl esterase